MRRAEESALFCCMGEKMGADVKEKKDYHAVSLSGGKDSTAMLLMMLDRGMPVDGVFWADTGMEFPEMYGHIAKVDDFLFRERGLHIHVLRHPKGFEWLDGGDAGPAFPGGGRRQEVLP